MGRSFALMAMILTPSMVLAQSPAAPMTAEVETIVQGANAFAFDLYGKLASQTKGNLFFSPVSIHTAFAMTYAGTAGNTAQEMAAAMHYPQAAANLAEPYGRLVKLLNTPSLDKDGKPAFELVIANALWPDQRFALHAPYLESMKSHFGAEVKRLDFACASETSRQTINNAVSLQTKGRIPELLPASLISATTRLVLTNAIYFKSQWEKPFNEKITHNAPFTLPDGASVECRMMEQTAQYPYFENADLQLLELPYSNRELSMVLLLPKAATVDALEQSLNASRLSEWLSSAKRANTRVFLPRFKAEGHFSLPETLQALGMKDAFNPGCADFSLMSPETGLYISAAVHKAFVTVDEQGTEAAGATAVVIGKNGMPAKPKVFKADHPFLFVIRHQSTGAVLFAGRIETPELEIKQN